MDDLAKDEDIRELIVRMVARILAEHAIDPSPERSKGTSRSEFLRVHRGGIAATDPYAERFVGSRGVHTAGVS